MTRRTFTFIVVVAAFLAVGGGIAAALLITNESSDSTAVAGDTNLSGAEDPTPDDASVTPLPTSTPEEPTAPPATSTRVPPTPTPLPVLRELSSREIEISASSVLPNTQLSDGRIISYGVDNMLDGDITTAWNHDGTNGGVDPIGQELVITFDRAHQFHQMIVANGYQNPEIGQDLFTRNIRIREIDIVIDGQTQRATLADERGTQFVDIATTRTSNQLVIRVVSVFPGTHWQDLAITELGFSVVE